MVVFERYGRALRLLREKKGKSQKQVAAAAGVTPPMLSAYENERTEPELASLDKILAAMDTNLAELAWALDIVNDRYSSASAALHASPERGGGGIDADRRGPTSGPGRPDGRKSVPLSPELEDGYAQILAGLMRISRFVFETVAHGEANGEPE